MPDHFSWFWWHTVISNCIFSHTQGWWLLIWSLMQTCLSFFEGNHRHCFLTLMTNDRKSSVHRWATVLKSKTKRLSIIKSVACLYGEGYLKAYNQWLQCSALTKAELIKEETCGWGQPIKICDVMHVCTNFITMSLCSSRIDVFCLSEATEAVVADTETGSQTIPVENRKYSQPLPPPQPAPPSTPTTGSSILASRRFNVAWQVFKTPWTQLEKTWIVNAFYISVT